ncbi:MAG: glycosyltransferase family 4 protein [Desulfopila sp.]
MKILLLAPHPFYRDSRISIALKTVLAALAAEGHQPTCLIYPQGEAADVSGCRILRVPRLRLPGFSWKRSLYGRRMAKMADRLLALEHFDLLLGFAGGVRLARRLSKRHTVPYSLYFDHNEQRGAEVLAPSSPLRRWREKKDITAASGVLVADELLRTRVEQLSDATIVERLAPVSLYEDDGARGGKNRKTNLGKARGTVTLVYADHRLDQDSGMDLLLEAFSLACLDRRKLRLIVIGGSRSEISHYRGKAKQLGIAGSVKFIGNRSAADLPAYLDQADIILLPATAGAILPYELATFLDSGRPIIATRIEMHTRVLDDSTAMLVQPTDSELAGAIHQLIRNEQLKTELSSQAKNKAAREYSPAACHRSLRSFFQQLHQRLVSSGRPVP